MQENKRDFTLLTDLYELTMMQGYFKQNRNDIAIFDVFYRKNPSNNGYAIFAGLEQVIDYINNLHFSDDDIKYLQNLNIFDKEFIDYLKDFKFTGDIYSMEEGSIIFPSEPLLKVIAPLPQAQLVETAILTFINHQSLIATKAARVVQAAEGDGIMEFGLRRAQGADAGIYGARAAVIAGCVGTSNVLTGKLFDVPVKGTHAHSWIMSFDSEYEAFKEYASLYPNSCILLVDTYNTLKSGVPNAIRVFKEMRENGTLAKGYGIRLDSGDLAYVSKQARKMLDENGFEDAIISASSDLDEYLIADLKRQGCAITSWGVGTNLITSKDCPAFGGVYKLSAIMDKSGKFIPKIKLSENTEKITNPGNKKVYRIYDKNTNKIKADLICFADENFDESKDLTIYDPINSWKKAILKGGTYALREMLKLVFKNGKQVYNSPSVMDLQKYCNEEKSTLWPEYKRLTNPQIMHVDISDKLYDIKSSLLAEYGNKLLTDGE